MNPEERIRMAAGETDHLPPPPPGADGTAEDENLPGTGGPDDAGDVEVDPDELNLPGR
jgi:hypothetical protein